MEYMRLLLDYQAADLAYDREQAAIKDTETRKKLMQCQRVYKSTAEKLAEMEQVAKVKGGRLSELESQLASLTADMEDLDKDLSYYSECGDDELDHKQIKNMTMDAEKLYDAVVGVKKNIASLRIELSEDNKSAKTLMLRFKETRTERDALRSAYDDEQSASAPQLAEYGKTVAEIEAKLPGELMEQYKRIKTLRQNPVAVFKDSRCSGCNMQLPSNTASRISAASKPVVCENCGRILVLEG